jgi:hypothetical protein
MKRDRLYLFDTTLRDGQQTHPSARSRAARGRTGNDRASGFGGEKQ